MHNKQNTTECFCELWDVSESSLNSQFEDIKKKGTDLIETSKFVGL